MINMSPAFRSLIATGVRVRAPKCKASLILNYIIATVMLPKYTQTITQLTLANNSINRE